MDKAPVSRRDELLDLAATMFAERGLRATTVRDIADSAGILSGSLYHHFKSKEQMVEEVRDKQRANFCDHYKPRAGAFKPGAVAAADAARSELDKLFGK